jgi:hypothetical protein
MENNCAKGDWEAEFQKGGLCQRGCGKNEDSELE